MTFRLVGLMSLVLLLSLASFAFLMHHHHQEVMEEVTRTISDVGQATLRTFEFNTDPAAENVFFSDAAALDEFVLSGAQDGYHAAHDEYRTDARVWVRERLGEVHVDAPEGEATGMGFVVVARSGDMPHIVSGGWQQAGACDDEDAADCVGPEMPPPGMAGIEERFVQRFHASGELEATVTESSPEGTIMIQIADVRAVSDPSHGTFLRIPTVHAVKHDDASGPPPLLDPDSNAMIQAAALGPVGDSGGRREIMLPIATDQFQEIFSSFQGKTLFLFLGVFVVGMVLTASLAARFTRPVRRLDAGIRRLTEGDLDAQVDASTNDEIGRLGGAFNEMARRLRAHRERERELTRREKLSSLGRLAAGVAHDVRNPLHSIGLTLQHLQETARPTEGERAGEFDRCLDIIREEVQRLDRLVGNFLRFARSDRGSRVAVDLPRLLRDTAQLVEKEAERRGVLVQVQADDAVDTVHADVESIRSSILNLVLNSFEAMSGGGTVTLRLRADENEVLVEVADTGVGISEEDQERVFDFAYTTREDGHGLGLAMVHQVVVEDHGGRISLESRPGEGTRVLLAFPRLAPGVAS